MPKPNRGSRPLVPKRLRRDRKQVLQFIHRGRDLARALGASALLGEIEQLAASALKPFLFVAVGEVKSGKSSLINALLEAPVCAVDSAPCTDRVQEINYGEQERRVEVSAFEECLYLPHDILRHITIVDTPGTNSIIRRHQQITENYIPQSDLVLFVFFAKNPYTGSAWDFLYHIKHDWQRNTLFVLQQADLLEEEELERTRTLVKQQLAEEGIARPVIFQVSVLTGEGVDALRDYLRTAVVKGRQFNKSISLTHNLLRFLRRLAGRLQDHGRLLEHDDALLEEFRQLVPGSGSDAEQAYTTLVALGRHHGEEAQHWLDAHLGGAGGLPTVGAEANRHWPRWQSPAEGLRQLGKRLAGSFALRDALSGGWETPLRVGERFNQLQGEFNRCLFQAQLRSYNLVRQHKRRAQQLLEAMGSQPPALREPLEDGLARRRRQMLKKARQEIDAFAEPGPEEPVARLSGMRTRSRWLPAEHLIQAGSGLGCLFLGYYLSDLSSGLLLGLTGYLGTGYGLAVRSRRRVGRQARAALARALGDLEQGLHATLLAPTVRLQEVLQEVLGGCETNLAQRRLKIEELRRSVDELRHAVEGYESDAWLAAMQGED